MTARSLTALTATMLLAVTGCTSANRIVGHQLTQVGSWYGELGITGHVNDITVQRLSRVTKLSIIGDANKVVFEGGATLGKIEIWGEKNTIIIPEHLVVRINQVGRGNQIIRRPGLATEQPTPTPAADISLEPVTEPSEVSIDEGADASPGSGNAPE